MQPAFRRAYNATYRAERYQSYVRRLQALLGSRVAFRLAETPVFFGPELVARCERAAREIVAQLAEPERIDAMRGTVPARFAGSDPGRLPQFAVVDFAIARAPDGSLEPRVVELQGFPSLYAFEVFQRDAWLDELGERCGGTGWSSFYSGLDRVAYLELLGRTIVGPYDAQSVVLLDIEPEHQKTGCDFVATRALFGVDALDPRELIRRGTRLYRRDPAGRQRPVERIYNRLVGDDLVRPGVELPFDLRDDLDVSWAPHPQWFWIWSKASLPHLEHPAVPRTYLLSELDALPERLGDDYVLKPLFSFAGSGVDVHPTANACAAIPAAERDRWCLQEKIAYAPALEMPGGDTVKVELRVMFLRPEGTPALVPATNLCRLSRGEQHGVDHNRDLTWVGSSIGLWESLTAG
jgi:hypothetical protein